MIVGVLAASPALGQGRVGISPTPAPMSPGAPRAAVRPGVAPNVNQGVVPNVHRGVQPNVHPNVNPNVRPNVFRGVFPGYSRGLANGVIRRPGRFGGVGSGLALAGIGLSLAGDFPYPDPALGGEYSYPGPGPDGPVGGPYAPYPPIIPAVAPPQPCVRPLIIKVGQGLRRRTPTRVVYGSQPGCGRYIER